MAILMQTTRLPTGSRPPTNRASTNRPAMTATSHAPPERVESRTTTTTKIGREYVVVTDCKGREASGNPETIGSSTKKRNTNKSFGFAEYFANQEFARFTLAPWEDRDSKTYQFQSAIPKNTYVAAKIVGRIFTQDSNSDDAIEFTILIRKPLVALGRSLDDEYPTESQVDGVDVGIGTSNKVSRKHVEIEYDDASGTWMVRCAGKNDLVVYGAVGYPSSAVLLTKKDDALMLQNGSMLLVADCLMVFLEPVASFGGPLHEKSVAQTSAKRARLVPSAGSDFVGASHLASARSDLPGHPMPEWMLQMENPKSWTKTDGLTLRKGLLKFGFGRWDRIIDDPSCSRLADKLPQELAAISRRIVAKCIAYSKSPVEKRALQQLLDLPFPGDWSEEQVEMLAELERAEAEKDVKPSDRRKYVRWTRKFRLLKRLCDVVEARKYVLKVLNGEITISLEPPAPWWDARCDADLLQGTYEHGMNNFAGLRADKRLIFNSLCGTADQTNEMDLGSDEDDDEDGDEEKSKSKKSKVGASGKNADDEDDEDDVDEEDDEDGENEKESPQKMETDVPKRVEDLVVPSEMSKHEAGAADPGQNEVVKEEERPACEVAKEEERPAREVAGSDGPGNQNLFLFPSSDTINRRLKSLALACARDYEKDKKVVQEKRLSVAKELKQESKKNAQVERQMKDEEREKVREEKLEKLQPFTQKDARDFERALINLGIQYTASGARDWFWFTKHVSGSLTQKYANTLEEAFEQLMAEANRVIEARDRHEDSDTEAKDSIREGATDEAHGMEQNTPMKRKLEDGSGVEKEGEHKDDNAAVGSGEEHANGFHLTPERAERLLERLEFFRFLRQDVLKHPMLPQVLRGTKRLNGFPAWWKSVHDRNLLHGINIYGFNQWELMKKDQELGFANSIRLAKRQGSKNAEFPRGSVLARRADMLLAHFRMRVNDPQFTSTANDE